MSLPEEKAPIRSRGSRKLAEKANHHYIPQFYLRGFSGNPGRKARVFVFDGRTNQSFTTLVRNIGSKRHFNRVEAVDVEPNYLEDRLSELEDKIAPHLQQVIEARAFPTAEHAASILSLIALLSVRIPRFRASMSEFHKAVAERVMGMTVSSKELWTSQINKLKSTGVKVNDRVTYEDSKRFHEEGNYELIVDQTHLIVLELKAVDTVAQHLSRRSWCFAIAPEGSPFITCDDPVVLDWTDKVKQPTPYSPGHALQNTIVIFTLSPLLALVGLFEDLPVQTHYSPAQVAALNTAVARHSRNQIYAKDGTFLLHLRDKSNVRGFDIVSEFQKATKK